MLHGTQGNALARTCVTKLASFLQNDDQNRKSFLFHKFRLPTHAHIVKYIALLALVKIVPSHPYLVAEYQEVIMASVNDQDISIRTRALDLISAMASVNSISDCAHTTYVAD